MNLLILTQAVDINNPVLGFFHGWIEEFSKHFKSITVICLFEGEHHLPGNVKVLSLGKESGQSRLKYVGRFYKYIWRERNNYSRVFVHMNQEYVLLGGWFWCLLGKKVFMWRNHHAGNVFTDIAAQFCTKVFCTSKFSYTAKYSKVMLMPVGVNTQVFKPDPEVEKIPHSILFLARIASTKKPDLLLSALKNLNLKFKASFYGNPLTQDQVYYSRLKQWVKDQGLHSSINFYPGVPNYKTPLIYNQYQIFVNLSSSGMYDKTIFESAACGILPLSSNKNLKGEIDKRLVFQEGSVEDLTKKLTILLTLPSSELKRLQDQVRIYAEEKHSLKKLAYCLDYEISR